MLGRPPGERLRRRRRVVRTTGAHNRPGGEAVEVGRDGVAVPIAPQVGAVVFGHDPQNVRGKATERHRAVREAPLGLWDDNSSEAYWRNREPDQPFYSVINLGVTHEGQVRLSDDQFAERTRSLTAAQRHDPLAAMLPPYYPDTPVVRENWASYHDQWRRLAAEGALTGPSAQFFAKTKPAEELYDTEADPHEVVNLADDPVHADRLAVMRAALESWIVETGDLGEVPKAELMSRFRPDGGVYD